MAIEFSTTPAAATDTLATDVGMADVRGPENLRVDADLENNNDADYITARKLRARTKADEYIRTEFLAADLDWPVASDFRFRSRLASAADHWAVGWLMAGRLELVRATGRDDPALSESMLWHMEHAKEEIAWVIANGSDDDANVDVGTFEMVTLERTPECTEDEFAS